MLLPATAARNNFSSATSSSSHHEVLIEAVRWGCCEEMTLSDIFPIFIVAGALWILVYCILMTQKIFMDSHYQEIQPQQHGEEEDEKDEHHLHNHPHNNHQVESENHKHHDHNERTFFAYYL